MGEQGQTEAEAQKPTVDPLPVVNAQQAELNALKETYIKVAQTIDQMKEPAAELSMLRDTLRAAVECDRCSHDAAFAKFLWEDLAPGLAKRLNKERSNDDKYLEVVGDILEVLVRLFALDLKAKRFNLNFYSAMTLLFSHDAIIHKYHFQIPDAELKKLRTADQAWRKELQVGSWVDALVKADERGRLTGWMQAVITSVNQDSLYIEFPQSSNAFDTTIDRWSTELMAFESKTKADYEWRAKFLAGAQMLECDIHDKSVWCKGTVFEVKKQTVSTDRIIDLANCAFRVYRENPTSLRKDERGAYEGWSIKFDEWIPVYSPRIEPFATKVGVSEEEEIEEEMDELIECDPEFKRIYAVPRIFTCISACYLRYINIFGNEGGFDMIIDLLQNAEVSDSNAPDQLNINIMGCLAQILTMPYSVFHKEFIAEQGVKISKAIQHRLISSSDQSLRNVRKEQVDAIVKSIDQISRRFMTKDDRDKQTEVLRLELANKCLKSTYLERRISGIKDLNLVIRNNTLFMSSKTFSTDFLIDWMITNEVFTTIWDPRKTHAQLIQRSGEIFKLLLKEDRLDDALLKLFWSLTKSDYQSEIFKIISETSFYLKQPQIEFLFQEITSQVADRMSLAEFDCLCDLGKACKNSDFQNKVSNFFWHIIVNSESFKEDLVQNSIRKYAEMVKYWPIDQKKPLFNQLVEQLGQFGQASLPTLRLFTKIIKDQLTRPTQDQSKTIMSSGSGSTGVYPANNVVATFTTQTSSGDIVTSYSYKQPDDLEESIYNTNQQSELKTTVIDAFSTSSELKSEKELTFTELLNSLSSQLHIVDILLENLANYCRIVREAEVDFKVDRRKLHVLSNKYSHADEIEERLQFLKYYASISDYQFRKVQLRVIYDSLSNQSPISSDQSEFLNWCKQACEATTQLNVILDLNEVGEYFTELIGDESISVETLPLVGFEFIQNYFISINENDSKILRHEVVVKQPIKQVTSNVAWNSYYVAQPLPKVEEDVIASDPGFRVLIHPSELLKVDLIWNVVMNSKNEKVVERSVDFLIKIYMALDDGLFDERTKIAQYLISQCMDILKERSITSLQVQRVVTILQSVIQESEKKGAGDVQPHNAILQGESLDRIIIKNQTRPNAANLVVRVLTSATVWEFVDKVSRMVDLAPHYVEFRCQDGSQIKDKDYGKTLREISMKNHDIITVKRLDFEDEVKPAHVIDPATNELTERATQIFSEWFDNYSNKEGFMTQETTTLFIQGATGECVAAGDNRIAGLFKQYDEDQDGKMKRSEFLGFYADAARDKVDRVYDNLKNHFIRQDLVKLSEVVESYSFSKEQMPRFTLSHNQDQFDTLMALLDRKDESSDQVWQLIRMLATNQKIYDEVISIRKAVNIQGGIDWNQFFDSESVYRQIYNQEIIEAIMEDNQQVQSRVVFVCYQDYKTVAEPKPPKLRIDHQKLIDNTLVLKQNWSNKFLQNGGLVYLYTSFVNSKSSSITDQFELRKINFMMAILRVFISAAISSQDSGIQESLVLARRASSLEKDKATDLDSQGNNLLKLFAGLIASDFLDQIDFRNLQNKLLKLISDIVRKDVHTYEEKNIVSNSLNLWIGCVLYQKHLFLDFLTYDKIDEIIMSGILYCPAEKIREDFKFTLLELAKQVQSSETESALGFQLKLLSGNFHKISLYPCRQFFDLFNEIIDYYFVKVSLGSEESDLFDPEQLLGKIIDKIRADKATNKANTSIESGGSEVDEAVLLEQAVEKERLMIGLVQLTGKIIAKVDKSLSEKIVKEKDLINEIFKEFLFSSVFSSQSSSQSQSKDMLELIKAKMVRKSSMSNQQRTQANKSRESAYQLLNELIRKSPVILSNFIQNQLFPLLELIKRPKQWNYTPPSSSERLQKYVGLKNLGCICYMNSMLQQFFMIPAFRYNLLCVDDGVKEELKKYKEEIIDDNMLHQIQRLLAHLELSERNDYNPIGFTFSFKEFDGTPTNISEQKDAQEFLNVLFDRVENALKPTPRKYLLQSIFGGKTCSQLVCQECGKIKNRIEDYYNLSLTVKDIKSVYESLEKQVEGEVINDYQCDGCNKKVDVSKRVLIAETPNVLIIHLQRILFNFDTFRNDKLNQHFEFPTILDLKPYSYYDVMKREQRLPNEQPKNEDDDEAPTEIVTEASEAATTAKSEDEQMPIEDDCFEYKLVGVNVHSGSANAGHYWSYINTQRGLEEKDSNDPAWLETDKDQWMEFNDSTVKDYQFSNLQDECFGDKPAGAGANFTNAWGLGGAYGKSGYMLFYERRIKKPIKIVVSPEAAQNQPDIIYNEQTKEHIKLISYREGIDKETPNQIFQKVLEDNTKFTFENDIYSKEFYDFIKQILYNVAQFGDNSEHHELRVISIEVAKKVAFDILARCFYNSDIKELIQAMIYVFKQDKNLIVQFCAAIINHNSGEALLEILLDCTDQLARLSVAWLFKFLLCSLKEIEKDYLINLEEEKTNQNETTQPKSVCVRYINLFASIFNTRVAKAWARFENFLDLISSFVLYSSQEIETQYNDASNPQAISKSSSWSAESEACQTGLEFFFKINMLERLLDFILGAKSPLAKKGDGRAAMGGSYSQPNLSAVMKIVTTMLGAKNLLAKYSCSAITLKMMTNKEILGKILEENSTNKDFSVQLTSMCFENYEMTRKISKVFLKSVNQPNVDKVSLYLKTLKKFLLINDSLKIARLEWIFGISQLVSKAKFRSNNKYEYGLELVDRINDEAYTYVSSLLTTSTEEPLMTLLLKQRGRMDTFCIKALKDLMSLCLKDVEIAKYIYRQAPPSYQYARYSDWFKSYIELQKQDLEKNSMSTYSYYQVRNQATQKAILLLQKFEELSQRFAQEDLVALKAVEETEEFKQTQTTWLALDNKEVIMHYPPQVIIGKQVQEEREIVKFENEYVQVTLQEVDCEYAFSNPTGLFNLSLPDKFMRTKNYTFISYQQVKDIQNKNKNSEEDQDANVVQTRDWETYHSEGPVLALLQVKSKIGQMMKVEVKITIEGDHPNVSIPNTSFKQNVFSNDTRLFANFQKLVPGQPWGANFVLHVITEGLQPLAIAADTTYPSTAYGSQKSDAHIGTSINYDNQDTAKICPHCKESCFVGESYCGKCGLSLDEDPQDGVLYGPGNDVNDNYYTN